MSNTAAGIASTIPDEKPNANVDTTNHEWIEAKTRGRWARFWNGHTFAPPNTTPRKKARQQKYAFKHLTTPGDPRFVPLHLCMTGDELTAERPRIRGDGTSFRVPRTDEARELVALLPHSRLRTVECLLLVAIAYAMLERRRHGLVATIAELGDWCGLKLSATREAAARLIALGFVHAEPTYTRFGKCESQRANLWRLTTQALDAFALRDVPEGVAVPDGVVDRARLQQRRHGVVVLTGNAAEDAARLQGRCTPESVGSHASATHRNPDTNPDALRNVEKKSDSFRNGHRRAGAVGVVAATPRSGDCRTAVDDVAVCSAARDTRQAETRSPAPAAPDGDAFGRATSADVKWALWLLNGGAS